MNQVEKIIQEIIQSELGDTPRLTVQIEGLGTVNMVYDINGANGNYIIRLNDDPAKKIEYRKEKWCIEKVASLGVYSPKLLATGMSANVFFMIQEKVPGKNGKLCSSTEKEEIWKTLGQYARKFHEVASIEDKLVNEAEFHDSWRAKLIYNLKELNPKDSLLKKNILSVKEHKWAKQILSTLKLKTFKVGLIHGDLCPRNVIYNEEGVCLLDWGTADISVVPHNELGLISMSKEASEEEFLAFLEGYGISISAYQRIENEIKLVNFLHVLDKYRWAEGYQVENIEEFERNVQIAV